MFQKLVSFKMLFRELQIHLTFQLSGHILLNIHNITYNLVKIHCKKIGEGLCYLVSSLFLFTSHSATTIYINMNTEGKKRDTQAIFSKIRKLQKVDVGRKCLQLLVKSAYSFWSP